MRTKAEDFRNAPKPNFDLYVKSFICTNFEAFTTFSAIFTRIRCTMYKLLFCTDTVQIFCITTLHSYKRFMYFEDAVTYFDKIVMFSHKEK